MSPRGNRTASALLKGMQAGAAQSDETPPEPPANEGLTGNWSRQAMRGLQDRLEDARTEASQANHLVFQGILEGSVPVHIPANEIIDRVGTDRIASDEDGDSEESFASLVENIRRRGLRTPIRVRPIDPDWRPDTAFPRDVSGQRFALQSGRRRLEACREIGIDPLCFLSFPAPGAEVAEDLQERFFENTVRKNLTTYERLYSIGLIAQETDGSSMDQIGEIIGVSKADVSRGSAVVEYADRIAEKIDPRTATRDQLDIILKKIRENDRELSNTAEAERSRARRAQKQAPALPFRKRETKIGEVKLRTARNGKRVLTLESEDLDDTRIEKLLKAIDRI